MISIFGALSVLMCIIIFSVALYLYALSIKFDFSEDIEPIDNDIDLMMDAEHGGLSRHWNWKSE